jgi:hypothetical protein
MYLANLRLLPLRSFCLNKKNQKFKNTESLSRAVFFPTRLRGYLAIDDLAIGIKNLIQD